MLQFTTKENNMKKMELTVNIAKKAGISKNNATKALDALTDTITNILAQGDSITIVGFGSFLVRDRAARVGRHPQTGEQIQIKASKAPVFRTGKALKEAINS